MHTISLKNSSEPELMQPKLFSDYLTTPSCKSEQLLADFQVHQQERKPEMTVIMKC